MKIFITLNCLVVVALATTPTILDLHSQWAQFKITHKKTYETIEKEQKRFEIFIDKLKKVEEHNKLYEQNLVSYKLGINQFSDLTNEEFASSLGGPRTKPSKIKPPVNGTFVKQLNSHLPDAFDWRNKSAVTPVEDEGDCHASWAFAVSGALESLYARKYGKLISLSKQELMECVEYFDAPIGCNFAKVQDVYNYVLWYGLASAKTWPYVDELHTCRRNRRSRSIYITNYQIVGGFDSDEDILAYALVKFGPISVDISRNAWQDYAEGIFTGDCASVDPNGSVLIVGYGTDDEDQDYWIVKNSWGKNWGENGYIRLPRYQNKCDITISAIYPLM